MEDERFAKDYEEIGALLNYNELKGSRTGSQDQSLGSKVQVCIDTLTKKYDALKEMEKKQIDEVDSKWSEELETKQQKENLELEVKMLQKKNKDLSEELDASEKKRQEVAKEINELQSAQLQDIQQVVVGDRREKSTYELLKNVTRIIWDLPHTDNTLQGAIASCSEIKPFSFCTKKLSEAEITRELWDMMKEGESFKI